MVSPMPEALQRLLGELRAACGDADLARLERIDAELRAWFAVQPLTADLASWAEQAHEGYRQGIETLAALRAQKMQQGSGQLSAMRAFIKDAGLRLGGGAL